jgi:hypothetical protein
LGGPHLEGESHWWEHVGCVDLEQNRSRKSGE